MTDGRWTVSRMGRALVVLFFSAIALVALASPSHAATAQTCDSVYGCTSTSSAPPTTGFVCHTVFTGTVYGPQTVEVTGAAPNEAVFVVLNNAVIAQGTTGADGSATVAFQIPAGTTGVVQAVVSGVALSALCDPPLTLAGSTTPVSLLAHTGFGVSLLVFAALALIAAGYLMRRRRHHRHSHHF